MQICNVKISCKTLDDLLYPINSFKHIITVNAEAIVRCQNESRLLRIVNQGKSTIDGQIPLWIFKTKYPQINIEKLSGSDLIYDICEWAGKNKFKVFLLGGNEYSNEISVQKLKKKYGIEIKGFSPTYSPYPFSSQLNQSLIEEIKLFSPQIIFVAFGMGKQEFWIDDNKTTLEELGVKIAIGCGGTFDFVAEKTKRAPLIIQNVGLEGIWRFLMEPKWFRLKRILLSCKIFYYALNDFKNGK